MEVILYPIQARNDAGAFSNDHAGIAARWALAQSGTFLVGKNNWWHGGAHFKSLLDLNKDAAVAPRQEKTTVDLAKLLTGLANASEQVKKIDILGSLSKGESLVKIVGDSVVNSMPSGTVTTQIINPPAPNPPETFHEAVQAIAPGKIIAYRLNREWKEYQSLTTGKVPGEFIKELLKYSTGFVLIEHNLKHDYMKLKLSGGSNYTESLYTKFRFYTLYMHLVPLSTLQKPGARLPWFLTTTRTDAASTAPHYMLRNAALTLRKPAGGTASSIAEAAVNGLVAISHPTLGDIWLEQSAVAKHKSTGKFHTAYPIRHYYKSASAQLDQPNADVVYDQVKVLAGANAIPVNAGDILGYPGGTIIDGKTMGGLFHFEVFAQDLDFLDNKPKDSSGNLDKPFYANTTRAFDLIDNKHDTATNPFASGQYYHGTTATSASGATPATSWQTYYHSYTEKKAAVAAIPGTPAVPATTTTPAIAATPGTPAIPEHFEHYLFDGTNTSSALTHIVSAAATGTNAFLEIYSDSDWKKGPKPWTVENATRYIDVNGAYLSAKLPASTTELALRFYSEWSDHNLNSRYLALKNNHTDYDGFINFVREHCFWSEVKTSIVDFPAPQDVCHFHPVGFIQQLKRIMTPYHDTKPLDLRLYLNRHTNETLAILRTRKQELDIWLQGTSLTADAQPKGTASPALKAAFKQWFGFYTTPPKPPTPPALGSGAGTTAKPSPAAGAGTATPPFTLPASPPPAYSHGTLITSLPTITNMVQAINFVRGIITRNIAVLEQLETSKYMHGFRGNFRSNYAYVYGADQNHHIHLAHAFLKNRAIDNTKRITVNDTKNPPDTVQTIAHECSHFHDVGQLNVPGSSGGTTVTGLYDLIIKVPGPSAGSTPKSIGPYGPGPCMDIATYHPVASLCNADNYGYFALYDISLSYNDTYAYF